MAEIAVEESPCDGELVSAGIMLEKSLDIGVAEKPAVPVCGLLKGESVEFSSFPSKEDIEACKNIHAVWERDEDIPIGNSYEFINYLMKVFEMLQNFSTDDEIKFTVLESQEFFFFKINLVIRIAIKVDACHFRSDNFFESIIIASDIKHGTRLRYLFLKSFSYECRPLLAIIKMLVFLRKAHMFFVRC
ncbi:hypothetical protein A2772_01980 [Candidatus Daviesbacteria bacterium RIFCSPHIGHO2_01_FULL_38_8b]|nr:MAG: hypothetical protein A2772_01980 [Candidatus Daviesbacteria bacterium RIFCSPHIGHO2_01_FULL_38_8b]